MVGSANNKAKTLRMEHVNGRKFAEKKKRRRKGKIRALLGMLARLPWGRRDMLGSMNGKHGGVSVKYVSLIVFCHWIKVFSLMHDSER